ncbi:MAG: hypothetical protein ACPG31_08795 [Planctomycetota bacterium]
MKQTPTFQARLLLPLLLLAGILVLWGLGLLGDAAPKDPKPNAVGNITTGALEETAPTDTEEPLADATTGDATLNRVDASSAEPSTTYLTVQDAAGRPVSGIAIGWRVHDEASYYSSFNLQHPPALQNLGTTNARGRVPLPEFPDAWIGFVVQEDFWLAIGNTVFEDPRAVAPILTVMPGGVITGKLVDAGGAVEGASLGTRVTSEFLFGAHEDERISGLFWAPANYRYATTDAHGRFRIGGLIPSSRRLDLFAAGNAPVRHEYEGPLPGQVRDIGTLTLAPGVEVTFHVQSPEPLEDGTLLYLQSAESFYCRAIAGLPLDEQGKLTLDGMRPGSYEWMVERPESVAMKGELMVPEGGGLVTLEVEGLREVTVAVLNADGQPLDAFYLEAEVPMGRPRIIQGSGTATFRCGAASTVRVKASAEGFVKSKGKRVPPSRNQLTINLQRFGALDLLTPGMTDGSMLPVDLADASQETASGRLAAAMMGRPLKPQPVQNGKVQFEALAPGEYVVYVDHGGGPMETGTVTILPQQTTEHQLDLPILDTIEVQVVTEEDGAPLAGVQVSLLQDKDPRFGQFLLESLSARPKVDRTSDAEGRFQFQILPSEQRYLQLRHPNRLDSYELLPADAIRPVRISMQKAPATPIQLFTVEGQVAAFAEISFARHDGWPALPVPLGHVSLDADGRGLVTTSPASAQLHASFAWTPEVQYSLPYGAIEVVDGRPLSLTLLPQPGWLALTMPPLEDLQGIEIHAVGSQGFQAMKVQCSAQAWNQTLPLPAGSYRIRATGNGRTLYTTCKVKAGSTTALDWLTETQSFQVTLFGQDWSRAQLRAEVVDGPQQGVFRDTFLDAATPTWRLEDFPTGSVEVKLVEWWDEEGRGHRVRWSKELPRGEQHLTFAIENFASATVTVVDEAGTPIPNTLIHAKFGNTGAEGSVSSVTDSEGKINLLLRKGTIILQAYHADYRQQSQRRTLHGDETWTIRMKS